MSALVAARCLERDGSLRRSRSHRAQFQPLFVADTCVQPFVGIRNCSRRATRGVSSRRLADEHHRLQSPYRQGLKTLPQPQISPSPRSRVVRTATAQAPDVPKRRLVHLIRLFRCHRFETIAVLQRCQ
ncbi:MAG: hypothetical protein K0R38_3377 [Polyangiaceae bacterium]|nr:hypothetical protein [Polyangiaceae bacterium]